MINPLTLRYKDKSLEGKFKESSHNKIVIYLKYQIYLALLFLFVSFVVFLIYLFGKGKSFRYSLLEGCLLAYVIRFLAVSLIYFIALKYYKFRKYAGFLSILITEITLLETFFTPKLTSVFLYKLILTCLTLLGSLLLKDI